MTADLQRAATPLERAGAVRLGRTLGIIAVIAGMALYRSDTQRVVLDRWSPLFFAALVVMAFAAVVSAVLGSRAARAIAPRSLASRLLDRGVLVLGAAYLAAAIDDPVQGGRLLDFNLFGSVAAPAAALEWVALVLLFAAAIAWLFGHLPRLANATLAVAAIGGTLLLGEGLARAWTLGTASTHLGNASRVWTRRHVQRNTEGARDVNHALVAAPGTHRLLVVGDSYAFGWGVPRIADRFGEQLATLLSANGERWEAINVSEPDKQTLQEFEYLRRGLRYGPELVTLIYVFNDMDYLVGITPRPLVAEAPHGVVDRLHPLRLVYANSYLFQEIYARLLAARQRQAARAHSPFAVYDDTALVRRHLGDLARFVAVADSAGAAVAIVPVDIAPSVDAASLRRYERFVAQGTAAGLPFISIPHAFDGHPVPTITVSSLDGHPNALGHHLAAAAAAPALRRLVAARANGGGPQLAGGPRSPAATNP